MIKPLQLGNKQFPVNIIQGPLAGISCASFRSLIWQYSQPAFSCTEMISCKTLIHRDSSAYQRYVKKDAKEGPVCFQLSANNSSELAEATKIVTDHGADLIDLNCGCPVKKIRSKGAGSSLLTDVNRLYQLITAMKHHTHIPVSIKIRVQGNSHEQFNQDIANIVNDAGADFLVVHGRHWSEDYATPCRYEDIEFFVNRVMKPVIGNGDIACITSLKKMFATGCAGVMISRASVGQPWLIGQCIAEIKQTHFSHPSLKMIGMIFFEHVVELAKLLNNEKLSLLQARKFGKYYARPLPNKTEFNIALNNCVNLYDLAALCQHYFG